MLVLQLLVHCLTRLHPTQLLPLYPFEIKPPYDEVCSCLCFCDLFLAPLHVTATAVRTVGSCGKDQVILWNLDEPCSSKQQQKSFSSRSASSNLCCQLGLLAAGTLRKFEVWSCNVKNTGKSAKICFAFVVFHKSICDPRYHEYYPPIVALQM